MSDLDNQYGSVNIDPQHVGSADNNAEEYNTDDEELRAAIAMSIEEDNYNKHTMKNQMNTKDNNRSANYAVNFGDCDQSFGDTSEMDGNLIADDMANDLLDIGFDIQDIMRSIKEANLRLIWNVNSRCLIYSQTQKIWFEAQITDIFIDELTNEEWLTVKYNDKQRKNIQRFNDCIIPMNLEHESNLLIIEIIANKLREQNIERIKSQTPSKANQYNANANLNANKLREHYTQHIESQIPLETNDLQCNKSNYKACAIVNRLFDALKHYSMLKIMENKKDEETFRRLMNDKYYTIIDDCIHFKDIHSNDLEKIYTDLIQNKIFSKCNINGCEFTSRHYRKTDIDSEHADKDNNTLDPRLNFYKETLDSFHFYLFHCFEAGLRTMNTDDDDSQSEEEKGCGIDYFDATFARIHREILKREQHTKAFERFSIKNTKFNILTQSKDNNDNNDNNDTIDNENLYSDEIFKYLLKVNVTMEGIKGLYCVIQKEEYDTDSLKYDETLKSNGNIVKNIENKMVKTVYVDFIKDTKISSQSFAIGFRFYYWIYYKHRKQLDDKSGLNINDHSGFEVRQLLVEAKYDSLKEETTNNKHILWEQYEAIVIKVNEHQQSDRFKKITATHFSTKYLHYDIKKGDSIRFEHLLSLVLYTDYTALCTEFSGTFRRKRVFEPLKSVIKRNMEYFWMSKYLRECVEVFGQCYEPWKERWQNDSLRGPFYSGMRVTMNLNSFNMRLCSPTSASTEIAVAMNYSGCDGMVVQLNNPNTYQYDKLHGFNASWISKYKEEDERLFFGGAWFIKIESVRLKSTNQNFEKFMFSMYYLDAIVTGGEIECLEVPSDDVSIIQSLMNAILDKDEKRKQKLDDYLCKTFVAFTSNKTQIVLDLYELNKPYKSGIRDLLMNNLKERRPKEEKPRGYKDMTNLFKPEIFEIFKNIQNIIINTSPSIGFNSFSVSMMALLTLIESRSVQQIMIKAKGYNNWIKDLWKSSANRLTKSYDDRNYSISLKEKEHKYHREYSFIINKRR